MPAELTRADAHIHLFETSFLLGSFTARPGVRIDEVLLYKSLADSHGVKAALVVGWAGAPWAAGNSAFLARIVGSHSWVHPTAYVDVPETLTVATLEERRQQGFVGISFYIHTPGKAGGLALVPNEVWQWFTAHRWLISVNSAPAHWPAWVPVLRRYPELRIVMSHLGQPPAVAEPPKPDVARRNMGNILALAEFPGPRVKLSGFYGSTIPTYDYPHQAAWPYVEALSNDFGVKRLVWGSDFSPCLDHLTFPQTLGLFTKMPFLSDADRRLIEGENLLALLKEVAR
jgi:L-fuconolactonase